MVGQYRNSTNAIKDRGQVVFCIPFIVPPRASLIPPRLLRYKDSRSIGTSLDMHLPNFAFALGFAALAHAAQNFTVVVGMNMTKTYTPSFMNATTGDTIIFEFVAGNHTLTQSSFAAPCESAMGVDSGFMPGGSSAMPMTFEYTVTDNSPMWFYCRQAGHCQQGMVFALNPTPDMNFTMFQQAAKASGSMTGTMSMPSPSATMTSTKSSDAMMLGSSIAGVVGSVGLAWVLL